MLQNAYLLAKIGADTAENEQHFAEISSAWTDRRPGRGLPLLFRHAGDTGSQPSPERLRARGSRLRHLAESCRIFSRIFAENEPRPVFCIDQGSRDLIWERFYPFLIGGSGAGRSGSLKVGPARVFQDRHAAPEGDVFLREDESERHRLCAAGR